MDRRRIAERAALGAAVVGALFCISGRIDDAVRRQAGAREVTAQAERLGERLQSLLADARLRADGLAALPVVRAAVETDAATVRDLARTSSFFALASGQALALYQIPRDNLFLPLYHAPENSPALPAGAPGSSRVTIDDDALRITVTAAVDPMYDRGALRGALSWSARLPLASFAAPLEARALAARLDGLDEPLPLDHLVADGPLEIAAAVSLPASTGLPALTLRAQVVTHLGARLRGAGLIVLGLASLALLGLKLEGSRRPADPLLPLAKLPPPIAFQPPPTTIEPPQAVPSPVEERRESGRLVLAWSADDAPPLPQLVPSTTDSTLAPPPPSHARSEVIAGRYRIIQHLGAGSAGDVYLAQATTPGPTVVALKLLRPSSMPISATEFQARAERTATLAHEHVARLYDFGASGDGHFLAMEYVEGCSLACLLLDRRRQGETMPLNQMLRVLQAVCLGLDAAHAHGIVHGDVKPSNVLVGRHGAVKVSDFPPGGGARLSDALAPELRLGRDPDARTDVFAVGAMLRELTLGAPHSRRLEAILRKALQPSPRRRFASCRALGDALGQELGEAQAPAEGELEDWVERVRRSM